MAATQVSAKRKDDKAAITVNYDFGADLAEATKKFGADVIFAKFKQSATIDLQSLMRRALDKADKEGKPLDIKALQGEVNAWTPDNKVVVRKSAEEKATEAISAMSAEEKANLIKKLRAEGLLK